MRLAIYCSIHVHTSALGPQGCYSNMGVSMVMSCRSFPIDAGDIFFTGHLQFLFKWPCSAQFQYLGILFFLDKQPSYSVDQLFQCIFSFFFFVDSSYPFFSMRCHFLLQNCYQLFHRTRYRKQITFRIFTLVYNVFP